MQKNLKLILKHLNMCHHSKKNVKMEIIILPFLRDYLGALKSYQNVYNNSIYTEILQA